MKVNKLENNVYQTQYILDDGSMILVSDKYGKAYLKNGKSVPNKNWKVLNYMNEELQRFLKKQTV
jgi:hypothetical protein